MQTSHGHLVFPVAVFNLREARGWSQQDLADKLNELAAEHGMNVFVSANTVSRWERGVIKRPQPLVRQLLAELFEVPLEVLGLTRERVDPASHAPEQAQARVPRPHLEPSALDRIAATVEDGVHEAHQRWRAVRRGLNTNRLELSEIGAQLHRTALRVDGTALLSCAGWLPATPVELSDIALRWLNSPDPPHRRRRAPEQAGAAYSS